MTKKLLLANALVALLLLSFTSNTKKYGVNLTESKVTWLAEKVTGEHNGEVKIKEGNLQVNNGKLTAGDFTIDMTTITCLDIESPEYNQKLVNHLKSEDFFSVDKFETASFKITKAEPAKSEDGNYMITGNLSIKGITNEISFPAQVDIDNEMVKATATIIFDRSKFDVRYRSTSFFDSLGDKAIYDDVEMGVKLVASL